MKIVSACIYVLNIPFVESFAHSLHQRNRSDSIMVKLTTDGGISGFGEGLPRPYVTGETVDGSAAHIRNQLLPLILGVGLDGIDIQRALSHASGLLPSQNAGDKVIWNASRSAVELAFLDCLFRARNLSINTVLPARAQEVTYSGVIGAGSTEKAQMLARRFRKAGLQYIKMKVCACDDVARIAIVRDTMGPSASIRLDANGAFDHKSAMRFLDSAVKHGIECVEQPIPRGKPSDLAAFKADSPIPVMADESLVTIQDAEALIDCGAVDYFNLRISKCGGFFNTLAIAELARSEHIGIQLGCQVGESAVLSAAGRHVAAYLPNLRFVEGSYGTQLLQEDVSEEDIVFGQGGNAPVLTGAGLGVTVREELLEKYARNTMLVRKE